MAWAGAPIAAALWGVALCVAASFGHPLSFLAFVLLPLPLLVAAGRGREGAAALASFLTAVACLGAWGPPVSLAYLVLFGAPAILASFAALRGARVETVVAAAVTASVLGAASMWAVSGVTFAAVRETVSTGLDRSFADVIDLYRQVGVGESQLSALQENRAAIVAALVEMVPSIVVTLTVVLWFGNLWLSGRWIAWPQLQDLARWQAPPQAIWLFIAAGFAMFTPLGVWARNIFAVMLAIYFLQGAAVVSYYLGRLRVPGPLRVVVLLLAVLEQILGVFVLLLGIFDLWGDFRRLGRPGDALVESD